MRNENAISDSEDTDIESMENEDQLDGTFSIGAHSSEDDDYCEGINVTISTDNSPTHDNKFIVFWGCLLQLLRFCFVCDKPAIILKCLNKGTMIIVTLVCENKHTSRWCSQPIINGMAA